MCVCVRALTDACAATRVALASLQRLARSLSRYSGAGWCPLSCYSWYGWRSLSPLSRYSGAGWYALSLPLFLSLSRAPARYSGAGWCALSLSLSLSLSRLMIIIINCIAAHRLVKLSPPPTIVGVWRGVIEVSIMLPPPPPPSGGQWWGFGLTVHGATLTTSPCKFHEICPNWNGFL